MAEYDVSLSITGLQEAQKANAQDIRAVSPDGALGEAIRAGTILGHRYAIYITHVDTGAWKASHRMDFRQTGQSVRGEVYVDPSASNPRSPTRPVVYATIWEERCGEMAVYNRTVQERGKQITNVMEGIVIKGLAK